MTLTRFAPAPTGYLHLGHVLNAQTVWSMARETGARVLLRIEDHDRERSRAEYERAILEDLDWLGFVPDLFPTAAFRAGRCDSRQSDRARIYERVASELRERGLLYGCTCSRNELRSSVSHVPGSAGSHVFGVAGAEVRYPGTCRERGIAIEPGVAWRIRLDRSVESFTDLLSGPQEQIPSEQCGDLIIRDRLGNWTYQFVVTVDDHLQGIDLVIRGRDLLASTGRQIQLARLIGRGSPATFAHHALIMKSPARKLSKSDGDTGIHELRRRGLSRDDVLAMADQAIRNSTTLLEGSATRSE